jgi:hypothetical protein
LLAASSSAAVFSTAVSFATARLAFMTPIVTALGVALKVAFSPLGIAVIAITAASWAVNFFRAKAEEATEKTQRFAEITGDLKKQLDGLPTHVRIEIETDLQGVVAEVDSAKVALAELQESAARTERELLLGITNVENARGQGARRLSPEALTL